MLQPNGARKQHAGNKRDRKKTKQTNKQNKSCQTFSYANATAIALNQTRQGQPPIYGHTHAHFIPLNNTAYINACVHKRDVRHFQTLIQLFRPNIRMI